MPYRPFRIEFTKRSIADLHRRLDATRWPQLPFATGWDAGADDATMVDLVRYWRREFDWFGWQRRLNQHAQIRGPMGTDEELHAVLIAGQHGPGQGDAASTRIPLLLMHGWLGSFIELLPAAERLAQAGFDVVVPSLPGFGFSDAPRAPGAHPGYIAERMHMLMRDLGYTRYGVQGGDWGAIIGARLARRHPDAVVGLHLNFPAGLVPSDEETEWERRMAALRDRDGSYGRLQRTKPQTLSYALLDSPVGLLAWMLEKFHGWTDHRGDLCDAIDRETLLANVTLYWLTGAALSSARLYYEAEHETPPFVPQRCEVPTAFARYPGEPCDVPRAVMERSYHLVRWTEMERGGHFAALEQPERYAADVAAFFGAL